MNVFLFMLPIIVALLYALTAFLYLVKLDYGWAMVWGSYAMANIGLVWISINDSW